MKTWLKLLAVAAVLGLVVTDELERQPCDIDNLNITKGRDYTFTLEKIQVCLTPAITEQITTDVQTNHKLGDFRKFFREFCPNVPQVVTCMAEMKASVRQCQNREGIVALSVGFDVVGHLLTDGCENEGERLAYIVHGIGSLLKNLNPWNTLWECFNKSEFFLALVEYADIDLHSKSYLLYKVAQKYRSCMEHVEVEEYKPAMEWAMNEVVNTMKCHHPEEDRLVTCGDIDVNKFQVTNLCALEPLNVTNLYDRLEENTVNCHIDVINVNFLTDLESFKDNYKSMCTYFKYNPDCLLAMSSYAETCLSQQEDKQFELYLQSLEDVIELSCVDEGVRMANITSEVYIRTAEHGHALRECYNSVMENRKTHGGHAVSSKNMRFYHEMTSFKQCVVNKLHDNNDVSKDVESIINNILKKAKCVNPDDGVVVLCETINEH